MHGPGESDRSCMDMRSPGAPGPGGQGPSGPDRPEPGRYTGGPMRYPLFVLVVGALMSVGLLLGHRRLALGGRASSGGRRERACSRSAGAAADSAGAGQRGVRPWNAGRPVRAAHAGRDPGLAGRAGRTGDRLPRRCASRRVEQCGFPSESAPPPARVDADAAEERRAACADPGGSFAAGMASGVLFCRGVTRQAPIRRDHA